MFQVAALNNSSNSYHHIAIIITLSHIIFNVFHNVMTDRIKKCLIKLSNFRNVRFVERGKQLNPGKSLLTKDQTRLSIYNYRTEQIIGLPSKNIASVVTLTNLVFSVISEKWLLRKLRPPKIKT